MRTIDLQFPDGSGANQRLVLELDLGDVVQSDIWHSLKAGIFYEHETSRFFLRVARPGDVFYDIGANVGYFSLLLARLVGEAGKVVAFEANPRNCAALVAAAARNAVDVKVEGVALADHDGTARFRDNGDGDSNGALSLDQGGYEVRTVALDSFIAAGGPVPKLMKIDVEGAELQVLRGGAGLFADPRLEFVICEFNVPQLARFGTGLDDIIGFMAERGLHLYLLDHQGGLPRYVPPGVNVRMTSVANVLFARHEALAKYWGEVVNECYVFALNKEKG